MALKLAGSLSNLRSTGFIGKLAILFGLAVLLAGPLPLLGPVLGIGILTERSLAAASWEAGQLQADFMAGDVKVSELQSHRNFAQPSFSRGRKAGHPRRKGASWVVCSSCMAGSP